MADIRFVRPPPDNKIRNFSPLPRTNETLHITTPKHTANQPPRWHLFLTSTPRPCPDTNLFSQPLTKRKKSMEVPNTYHTDSSTSNEERENHAKGNKALFFHPTKRSASLACLPNTSFLREGEATIEDVASISGSDVTISSETNLATGFETSSLSSPPHEPDSSHSLQFMADIGNTHKCPVMQFYSSFTSASDSSLVDVRDEELEQLPEVQSPSGVFSSPARRPMTPPCDLQTETKDDQPDPKDDQPKITVTKAKPPPTHMFKRSVSSCDLEETNYTSFFGSLRKKETEFVEEEGEDERESPDNNFAALWDLRRAWILDPSIHRAQSADTLNEASKKSRQTSPSTAHSLTPVERLLADDEEYEEDEGENATPGIGGKASPSSGIDNSDRLKMRRGALAQPERMIMSQAVREKVQKDVQKRKASMVRKVSQFFNVQLGLNREEDLI